MSVSAVLGHFPDYVDVAEALGLPRFSVPVDVWDEWVALGREREENRLFLDESIRRGRFLLTTPPELARPGTAYWLEVAYLTAKGFRLQGGQVAYLP